MGDESPMWTGPSGRRRSYRIEEILGSGGGQGFLFRAELSTGELGADLIGQPIALKQLLVGAVGTDRIEELHAAVGAVRHPHFVRQLEVFRAPAPGSDPEHDVDDDLLYVASLWVPGRTLADVAPSADLFALLTWVRQVGEVLDVIHSQQVSGNPLLHRDVKPSNVIVTSEGNAVLIDPGLARPLDSAATTTPYGSPGFVPPEADRPDAETGPAADRWQLAATLYAALVGQPPVRTLSRRELTDAVRSRVQHEAGDREAFVDRLLEMLDPEPSNRPTSAAAWAADLWAAARNRRPRRRVRTLVAAGLAVVAVLAFSGGWALGSRDGTGATVEPTGTAGVLGIAHDATVFNKVTSGTELVEDSPGYLSSVPANFCRRDGCMLDGTDVVTGDSVTLVCKTVGARNTNGNDSDPGDDANPGLYESTIWYGIYWSDGRTGFLSDVWLEPDDRGGLDLPLC